MKKKGRTRAIKYQQLLFPLASAACDGMRAGVKGTL